MNIPIIKLEIQGMRHTVCTALTQHTAVLDENIQKAVEEFCRPESLDALVRKIALQEINSAVSEEIQNFFRWSGNGRKAIKEAVIKAMDERYPDRPEVDE